MAHSKRVERLLEDYPKLYKKYSPLEIAEMYGVARRTLYGLQSEIFERYGIPKEEQLICPQRKHASPGTRENHRFNDIEGLKSLILKMVSETDEIINRINNTIDNTIEER